MVIVMDEDDEGTRKQTPSLSVSSSALEFAPTAPSDEAISTRPTTSKSSFKHVCMYVCMCVYVCVCVCVCMMILVFDDDDEMRRVCFFLLCGLFLSKILSFTFL